MDDIQSYWLENIQEYVVQEHIDHNIPVTLGVIPGGVGLPFLTKIIEWDINPLTEIAQHDYTHDTHLIGKDYNFQYNYLSQGTSLLNSWAIYPKSFVPAAGQADDTTVQVIWDLGFNTIYNSMFLDLTLRIDPLIIVDQLFLCEGNEFGRKCNIKDYVVLKQEVDEKIQQYEVALILYHMQDFETRKGDIDIEKVNELMNRANNFIQDGYTLMTVEEYHQYINIAGDFDRDRKVDVNDLDIFIVNWLHSCSDPNWCDDCDIDYSRLVDFNDFSMFADNWMVSRTTEE
jgi:hypothetical protein